MVNYVLYAFDSIYYVMNSVYIPIPISSTHVYNFSVFSLFIALVVIGIAWFFFAKIFGIETNILTRDIITAFHDRKNNKTDYHVAEEKQGSFRRRKQGQDIYYRRRKQGIVEKSK